MRALITGGAGNIGAAITRALHGAGYDVIVHHHRSRVEAQALVRRLNAARPDSAEVVCADLARAPEVRMLIEGVASRGPLAVLVNNASLFIPTPPGQISQERWHLLLDVNAGAPLALMEGLQAALAAARGSVVNITDAASGGPGYEVYGVSKAALTALTRMLARRLAPRVRVNAVAPGAISWPEDWSRETCDAFLAQVPLARPGTPEDVAQAVVFLAGSGYVTGQVLAVDGGLAS